jgi:cytochrome oxidase Cu insertion factor (SCO1/SenC/PrrC family)
VTLLRHVFICAARAFSAQAADAPRVAPPLDILRPGTTPLKLSQYHGKVVVLALIFTSCSHCQEFTGLLNKVAPEYTARGAQFLECACNDDAPTSLAEFVARFHPGFPIGYNTQAAINTFLRRSVMETKPLYVPRLLVIDPSGNIQAEYPGDDAFFHNPEPALRAQLDKMLKPAPAAKKK